LFSLRHIPEHRTQECGNEKESRTGGTSVLTHQVFPPPAPAR
jgi:hypothetical protein